MEVEKFCFSKGRDTAQHLSGSILALRVISITLKGNKWFLAFKVQNSRSVGRHKDSYGAFDGGVACLCICKRNAWTHTIIMCTVFSWWSANTHSYLLETCLGGVSLNGCQISRGARIKRRRPKGVWSDLKGSKSVWLNELTNHCEHFQNAYSMQDTYRPCNKLPEASADPNW